MVNPSTYFGTKVIGFLSTGFNPRPISFILSLEVSSGPDN